MAFIAAAIAMLISMIPAGIVLYRGDLMAAVVAYEFVTVVGAGLTAPIQRFQSGVINDYVTWIVLGLAAIGGALALIIR